MRNSFRKPTLRCIAVPLLFTALAVMATQAAASPGSGPAAAVSMGDSFISGEAGRWNGNSNNPLGGRDGTDRAWLGGASYDPTKVYIDNSWSNGCHRSDVAEIRSAQIPGLTPINLACSGAETINLLSSAAGGHSFKGETPQLNQLATVARDNDVKLIVISIGGNDMGFSAIIQSCVLGFTTSPWWHQNRCASKQQHAVVDKRLPGALGNVALVIRDTRTTMNAAGYHDADYRLILQSAPSPIPDGSHFRYAETGWSRLTEGGCPFWNSDASWASGSLLNQLSNGLENVALQEGIEFLDLRSATAGHEICAKGVRLSNLFHPPTETSSEWVRFLNSGIAQGNLHESIHPNAYGQAALGACLISGSWIALVLTLGLCVLFDLKSRREEVWLAERYPQYAEYRERTRKFVPRLY